jgi:hypothetical protein
MKMSREFRGKRIDNGEWVYGSHSMDQDGNEVIFTMWKKGKSCSCCDVCDCYYDSISCGNGPHVVHPDSVGQYTGYKTIPNPDILKIYEGDLFELDDGGIETITFEYGCWYLGDDRLDEFNTTDGVKFCRHVGTIYENPNLLEGK